ncbi:hypothetical protein [Microbacterium hydrocarbonoxydans]|uniref:hypothetical protein n=1 Tax=Microbacterium hydrocarbonoxydans TaxID=273678 RepID=UPI00203AD0B4|nr:hypothetical protein [Microbacterium hydrocarbonoxydans]MCM3778769.1 hypothetical protein [Microbacterium hydrocarbonoxydans]
MSGINISHGGAISVDPDALRQLAHRVNAAAIGHDEAARVLRSAYERIVDAPGLSALVDTVALWALGQRAAVLHGECVDAAASTRLMADTYEYVELLVEARARGLGAAGDEARAGMRRLEEADARIPDLARGLVERWEDERFAGLVTQVPLGGLLGPAGVFPALVGAASGRGVIARGSRLRGPAEPVTVTPVKTATPSAAPSGLAGALNRIPEKRGAQVAVEKYSFSEGVAKYVVYVKGTQTFAPGDMGGPDPWDMKSNSQLYVGQNSASYEATLAAVEAAGAEPGDEVRIVAHSQGGMVASHFAMESAYDVPVVVTAGSPVDPTLESDQTLVALGFTDDSVRALAGGGSPAGTGSPDSVLVTAEHSPGFAWGDFGDPHLLASYVDLAEDADAAGDPRIESVERLWDELDDAEVIERTEYRAERVAP